MLQQALELGLFFQQTENADQIANHNLATLSGCTDQLEHVLNSDGLCLHATDLSFQTKSCDYA